ncbi:hypothetical protein GMRT_13336 [Giardia muris]|uniref:SPRY domain-containing protein n=1 Tax=Giardia muris TaxID=5742 RepID=A0A4Z1T1Q0_GIAMU|nr:hypothetical protein GMRT_13336 [Giardia muris]|eukprot:TNJ26301.1 hypothetical protein GMRT_13336 [Giardia muris]
MHSEITKEQRALFMLLHRSEEYLGETRPENLGNVCLSDICRDPGLTLSRDQLTVNGSLGYRCCRSTHGAARGTYYFEVTPEPPPRTDLDHIRALPIHYCPQWRLGISAPMVELGGPLGYDTYGFSLRSVDGSLCHNRVRYTRDSVLRIWTHPDGHEVQMTVSFTATPLTTYERGFFYGVGDTLGILLHLPTASSFPPLPEELEMGLDRAQEAFRPRRKRTGPLESTAAEPDTLARKKLVQPPEKSDERPLWEGSFVAFFLGERHVCTVRNLPYDRYYAAGSLYLYSSASFNFGPRNLLEPGIPRDWRCLPIFITPMGVGEGMAASFRQAREVFEWLRECIPDLTWEAFLPLNRLYLERATKEQEDNVALFLQLEMNQDLWTRIERELASPLTRFGPARAYKQ